MLYLIMGLPGTGKTYFAKALAERIGADHFNTDSVRAEEGRMGEYDEESKEKVYQGLLTRMVHSIQNGKDVVVDATFIKKALRDRFILAAEQEGADLRLIRMVADQEVVRKRIQKGRPDSEADMKVYHELAEALEPIEREHQVLDSGKTELEEMLQKIIKERKPDR